MAKFDEKAVSITVGKDLSGPDRFSVSFSPEPLTTRSSIRRRQLPHTRARSSGVQAGPPLWIATYIPPENSLPGFSRQDYESERL